MTDINDMKALVIDNQPLILKYMEMILAEKEVETRTAEDGIGALEILKSWIPDVVYVDLVMPNIDGQRLCRIMRSDRRLDGLVIVVLSAISAESEVDFQSFGADACIAKGPLNHMKQHVFALHELIKDGRLDSVKDVVLGLDAVYKRGITEELLSARKHFELILANASEGIIEVNPLNLIVYANQVAALLLGEVEEKLLGTPFLDYFDGSDQRRIEQSTAEMGANEMKRVDGDITLNERLVEVKLIDVEGENGTCLAILRDVTKERRDAKAIQKSLEEKEILLREIHHRVKNNLAMISSLINLQGSYVSIADGVYLLDQLKNRIRSISLVHDMLYRSDDLAELDMEKYIHEICSNVMHTATTPNRDIDLKLQIDAGRFDIDAAIPIGLIITELVSNATKHAFPEETDGTIRVILVPSRSSGWYELTVADDGVGFDADSDSGDSLGLKLVTALADQLKGTVNSDTTSKGSSVTVLFRYEGQL